jgi:hypothetical protein
MAHEVSQIEGIHEIDDAVKNGVENSPITPNYGGGQSSPLVVILILNLCHCNIETMAAFFDQAFHHPAFVF